MPTLSEKRAAAEKAAARPPEPAKEVTMFLVTNRRITVNVDRKNPGAPDKVVKTEASLMENEEDVEVALVKRNGKDDRAINIRVWALTIAADGTPTLGDEV